MHGTVKYLAGWFKVNKTALQGTWILAFETSYYNGDTDVFALLSRKFCAAGRHPLKYNCEEIIAAIRDIPYRKCTTYRKLSAALSFPKSTVFCIAKDNRENNAIGRTQEVR